jgi:hypothetical protein
VAERVGPVDDELEPFTGRYDWEEAFRQNPGQGRFDVPRKMRDRNHGTETAEDAQARALAEETDEWLAIVADLEGL